MRIGNAKVLGVSLLFGAAFLAGCQDTVGVIDDSALAASGKFMDGDLRLDREDLQNAARLAKGEHSVAAGNMNGGNDNGGNDNGGNGNGGNDNGGNGNGGNDNGGGLCADGSFKVDTDLYIGGSEVGDMEYREFADGCHRFRARADGMASGTYDVVVQGLVVGQIVVGGDGEGELEYDTANGTFPENFPMVNVGDVGEIGSATGTFQDDCIGDDDVSNCTGNGNGNDNGGNGNGGNDNGGNDNTGGNDNGGNDNTGGNDNGGNDNTGGNDNGGNDNTGGNDNGGNDNGGNDNTGGNDNDGNANVSSCMEYVVRVEADLTSKGSEEGEVEYRLRTNGDERFRVKVEGFAQGVYDVAIGNVVVGQIVVDDDGKGEIEYRTQDGNFPDSFPDVVIGDTVDVDLAAIGVLENQCDSVANDNSGNDNGGNDNGGNDNDDPMENENSDDASNSNTTLNG